MNIAIIDDLKTDSDRLVELINTYMEQHRLQCRTMDLFSSGEAFLDTFTAGKYHLIFSRHLHGRDHRNGDCKTNPADGP